MEKIKTQGFSAKDEFNAANSTPIKVAKNTIIRVTDIMVKDKLPDDADKVETVGYLKAEDGTIYAIKEGSVIIKVTALSGVSEEIEINVVSQQIADKPKNKECVPPVINGLAIAFSASNTSAKILFKVSFPTSS